MNDVHIRAILLMVIAAMNIGGAVAIKLLGATGAAAGLMVLVGLAAFVAAGFLLLFAESATPQERQGE